ncbi:MAG TPA: hypothetical protein VHY20_14075 [Pirellulales bacterium]|jgi:hypothetical protein|nr:hypothetical protein [Pirellulales bacterium]
MDHKQRWLVALLLVAPLLASPLGCQGVAPPYWWHPGTEEYQQARAQRFDPYAEAQVGPDTMSVDGSRPRDFSRPASEVKRAQTNADAIAAGVDSAQGD